MRVRLPHVSITCVCCNKAIIRVIDYIEREVHRLNDTHISLTNCALDMLQLEPVRLLYGFPHANHLYFIFRSVHSISHLCVSGTYNFCFVSHLYYIWAKYFISVQNFVRYPRVRWHDFIYFTPFLKYCEVMMKYCAPKVSLFPSLIIIEY